MVHLIDGSIAHFVWADDLCCRVLYFNSAKNECDTTRRAETCGDFRWWFRWHHTGEGTRAQVRSHAYRQSRLFQYVPGVPGAIVGSKPLGLGSWATHADSSSDQVVVQNGLAPRSRLRSAAPHDKRCRAYLRSVLARCSFTISHSTTRNPGSSSSGEIVVCDYGNHHLGPFGLRYWKPVPITFQAFSISIRVCRKSREEAASRTFQRLLQVKLPRARHVMVVGGGIVGVELAAELAKAASRAPRRITLVHGGARLMDDLPASVGERAAKWLRKHGVSVLVGERYVSVPNDSKTIKVANIYRGVLSGTTVTPDEVIVATGARPATEFLSESEVSDDVKPEHIKVPLDGSGRIRVDKKTFRVDCTFCGTFGDDESGEQQPEIYAIGDCVAKPADQYLASYAHWEAEYVASRILRGATVGSYKCPPRLICVSFGPNDGLLIWGDRILCGGFLAAVFKLIIEFWFKNFLPAPYSIFRHLPLLPRKHHIKIITRKINPRSLARSLALTLLIISEKSPGITKTLIYACRPCGPTSAKPSWLSLSLRCCCHDQPSLVGDPRSLLLK